MNIWPFLLIGLILSPTLLSTIPLTYSATPITAYAHLPCNDWTEQFIQWTEVGTDPYLDTLDGNSSYIQTDTLTVYEGNFTFTLLTGDIVSIENASLLLNGRNSAGGDITINIKDQYGVTISSGFHFPSPDYTNETIDIFALGYNNTVALAGFGLYFDPAGYVGSPHQIRFSYAEIIVGYTYNPEEAIGPIFPFLAILGLLGLVCMAVGPTYGISQIKQGEYVAGIKSIVIFGMLGFGLFLGWLGAV